MGVTHRDNPDELGDGTRAHGAAAPVPPPAFLASDEQPTQLLVGAMGERCAGCGAPLASDQRYCLHCGERRGRSRFAVADTPRTTQRSAAPVAVVAPEPARRRGSYGATLIAGVATLLLALGVGVEIGQLANRNSNAKPPAQQITFEGAGATPGMGTTAGTAGRGGSAAAAATSGHKSHRHSPPAPKTEAKKAQQAAAAPKPTQQAVQKASSAASGVLGANAGQQNATITTGQSCQARSAGCQNGKFNGSFFGGGQ